MTEGLPQPNTLRTWVPREFLDQYMNTPAAKLLDKLITREHRWDPWPGPQKNVTFWVELEDGNAVGWNENPNQGWTFPVIKMKGD